MLYNKTDITALLTLKQNNINLSVDTAIFENSRDEIEKASHEITRTD